MILPMGWQLGEMETGNEKHKLFDPGEWWEDVPQD